MSSSVDLEYLYPAITCVTFYAAVFGLAELSRRILDRVIAHNSSLYVFLIELIGTAQMCTCVYENGIMVKSYGVSAFFFTVACLLTAGGAFNRGAFVSPLAPIEAFYNGVIGTGRLLTLISAEIIGGMCAFRFARSLWYYSAEYSHLHANAFMDNNCILNYKLPFHLVILFEILGCFVIRVGLHYIPLKVKPYAIPAFISGMLSFAMIYVGVPALNPVVVSSRMFGCSGLDTQWFMLLYWVCPVIGWLIGVEFVKKIGKTKTAKKINKKKNK